MKIHKMYANGALEPLGTGDDILLSWNYEASGRRGGKQECFAVQLSDAADFSHVLHDSGTIAGGATQYHLTADYAVRPETAYYWRVRYNDRQYSPVRRFETALSDLSEAAWIECDGADEPASPVFFTAACLRGDIVSARAYVFGLGLTRLFVNGRADERFLRPANSVYDKVCLFDTVDITDRVLAGENLFEIQLGGGYDEKFSRWGYRYTGRKGVRAVFAVRYADGSAARFVTSGDWRWRASAVTHCELYDGEEYDARLADFAAFPVREAAEDAPKGRLIPDEMPPVRVYRELAPKNVWETADGTVYDFGENVAGVMRIEVEAARGTEIRLQHSELIFPDGTLDTQTNREARARDHYICAGGGVETYTPRFTYHGFRYVLVTVSGGEVTSFSPTALFLSADVETVGDFCCSDPTLNRIHALSQHSLRANFVSIPTDCPVRDERTPCQMDSQIEEDAAIYNFRMQGYYRKWLGDITSAGFSEGESNPDWHGDLISLVWKLYLNYGDLRPAEKYYDLMKSYVTTWLEHCVDGVWEKGFGDWCQPNDNTWETVGGSKMAVNTSLLYFYATRLSELATRLCKPEDAAWYARVAEGIKNALICKYLREDGAIHEGRQTEQIMPLYAGMFEGDARAAKVASALASRVSAAGHLDTGAFGTMAFLEALADHGYADEAYRALTVSSYPGFGWQIANGSASLWEQWAYTGIMHSHGHAFFAGIDASFYRVFCGVRPLEAGFARFEVKPVLPTAMQFAECALDTQAGEIRVKAEKISGGFSVALSVPDNAEATLILPALEHDEACVLFDGERPIEKRRQMTLGGGQYNFRLVPREYVYEAKL